MSVCVCVYERTCVHVYMYGCACILVWGLDHANCMYVASLMTHLTWARVLTSLMS